MHSRPEGRIILRPEGLNEYSTPGGMNNTTELTRKFVWRITHSVCMYVCAGNIDENPLPTLVGGFVQDSCYPNHSTPGIGRLGISPSPQGIPCASPIPLLASPS